MTRQQRLVLVIAILASFVAFLDGAIVNVALPAIARSLGGGLAVQQWVVDAYLLMLGAFILIAGSLSDLLGRRRIITVGLIGFGVASLLCALAPSSTALVIFRALQGLAGALLVPSSLAMIIAYISGPAQSKAIGTWTAWTGISFIIGPLVGGMLVDYASWRWIFAINVVPIMLTLYLLKRVEPPPKKEGRAKVDVIGAVLCALGLGGPVFALIEQPHYGWANPIIYLPLILGCLIFIGFLIYERGSSQPMLPISLFKNHNFSVGNIATLAIYSGLSAATFTLVIFLQQVNHYSALAAGLSLLPVTLIMFFFSSKSGALAGKYGPRLFMGLGPIIAGLGFLMMLRINANLNYWTQLLPAIVVFGLGLTTTVAPLTAAILGDVPPTQAGIASAVNNAVARVAGLVAVAAVGAIIASQFAASINHSSVTANFSSKAVIAAKQAPLNPKPPAPYTNDSRFIGLLDQASVSAFRVGILSVAILLFIGGVVSLIGIRNPAKEESGVQ